MKRAAAAAAPAAVSACHLRFLLINESFPCVTADCVACERLSHCLTGVSETRVVLVSPTGVHSPRRSGRRRGEDGASSETGSATWSSGTAGESGSRSRLLTCSVFMVLIPTAQCEHETRSAFFMAVFFKMYFMKLTRFQASPHL